MSVIAITHTGHDEIVCLSDGRLADEESKEVTTMDARKIWKISNSTALFWLGYFPYEGVVGNMRNALSDCATPLETATQASKFLKAALTPTHKDKLQGSNRLRICVLIVGFEDKDGFIYQLDSEQSITRPKKLLLPSGQSAVMGYNKEASDGEQYQRNLRKKAQSGKPGDIVCKAAFQEFLTDLEEKGLPVGGEIFCETILPKKKSVFRKALMN